MAKLMPSAVYMPDGSVVLLLPQAAKNSVKIAEIEIMTIILRSPESINNAS